MEQEKDELEKVLRTRLLRLNATIHGLVFGLVAGTLLFLATNWLVLKGGGVVGPNLALLNQFFIGYKVTFVGSIIGFVYAFVSGFLVGFFIARVYNWILDMRDGVS